MSVEALKAAESVEALKRLCRGSVEALQRLWRRSVFCLRVGPCLAKAKKVNFHMFFSLIIAMIFLWCHFQIFGGRSVEALQRLC